MTKIVNMGRVSRSTSMLAGVPEHRESVRSNKVDEKLREENLASALASQELRKREQDIANVGKVRDQFSEWWNGLDAQEKALAKTTDHYKEFQKFFKSFKSLVPGLVKDNGDIVPAAGKDMAKRKLENSLAKSKTRLANGTATEADIKLIKVGEKGLDELAGAIEEAEKAIKLEKEGPPKGFLESFGEVIGGMRAKFDKGFRGEAPATNPNTQALAATPATDRQPSRAEQVPVQATNDPLGIFGGR